mmetsp:Transcript_49618/g.106271  ORF Transcript_49618/g.106271 Transcript_49618/m.106271 type:complete len:1103 (+) Transcript_49618:217-3525(+)
MSHGRSGAITAEKPGPDEVQQVRITEAHDSEILKKDLSSRINVCVRCEALQKAGPTFVAVFTRWSQEEQWTELGVTEVVDTDTINPNFERLFGTQFRVEASRILRFEAYRVRDSICIEDLAVQRFLGAIEVYLVEAMVARAQGNGWLVKEMQNLKNMEDGSGSPGRIAVFAEEDMTAKQSVSFVMRGRQLKSTDFWKRRADTYCILNRTAEQPPDDDEDEKELRCTPLLKTEVQRKNNAPAFNRIELTVPAICCNDRDREIIIEVWDWFRVHEHRYIGECVLTFEDFHKAFRDAKPLVVPICKRVGPRYAIRGVKKATGRKTTGKKSRSGTATKESNASHRSSNFSETLGSIMEGFANIRRTTKNSATTTNSAETRGSGGSSGSGSSGASHKNPANLTFGKVMGYMSIEEVGVQRKYTFLDYVRGGLELRLSVAIDFTRSNVGPESPDSYHKLGGQGAYATAIRAIGEVLKSFDADDAYPVYGFGAKIPPTHTTCSDCFALTGDFFEPEVDGVDGIIQAYQRALKICRLHGPTRLHEIIRMSADMARPFAEARTDDSNFVDMKYFVLLVLTDGVIDDQVQTVNEVLEACSVPLSIAIVGIGDGDFSFLRELSNDITSLKRCQDPEQGGIQTRDIVHFVEFDEFRDRPDELAAATLAELPPEVVSFYNGRGVKPRGLDKLEDESGNPIGKEVPKLPERLGKGSANTSRSGSNSNQGSAANSRSSSNLLTGGASRLTSKLGSQIMALPDGRKSTRTSTLSIATSMSQMSLMSKQPAKEKRNLQGLATTMPYLREEKKKLIDQAVQLGYEKHVITRTLRDGIPAAALDVLVDNMMHAGYGKIPPYKELAEKALPDADVLLPGEVDEAQAVAVRSTSMERASSLSKRMSALGSRSSSRLLSASKEQIENKPSKSSKLSSGGGGRSVGTKESLRSQGSSAGGGSRQTTKDRTTSKGMEGNPPSKPSKSILIPSPSPEQSRAATKDGDPAAPRDRQISKSILIVSPRTGTTSRGATKDRYASRSKDLRFAGDVRFNEDPATEPVVPVVDSFPQPGIFGTCSICLERAVSTEFLPCGHKVACGSCAESLGVVCPMCQGTVREVRKLDVF